MTTTPFEPHRDPDEEEIAAADAGRGAPPPAPGFGVPGEEPDHTEDEHSREEAGGTE
jgi:hypothetical protein